ncbi:hypothetical protein [Tsukamurella soli]|uniref:Secreted protein n=1 Tax=Tsukamurella soli TaxID=644556 RepID=A0ABP8J1X3_9ACTN
MKTKIAAATVTAFLLTALGTGVANADYTIGGNVLVELDWYGGSDCAQITWPRGDTTTQCGGQYRVVQSDIRPGNVFGARIAVGDHDDVYCEVKDMTTGDIVTNDFASSLWANCLTNAN